MTHLNTNQTRYTDALADSHRFLTALTNADFHLIAMRLIHDMAKHTLALAKADTFMQQEDSKATVKSKDAKVDLMTAGLAEAVTDAAHDLRKAEATYDMARREYALAKTTVDLYVNQAGGE